MLDYSNLRACFGVTILVVCSITLVSVFRANECVGRSPACSVHVFGSSSSSSCSRKKCKDETTEKWADGT